MVRYGSAKSISPYRKTTWYLRKKPQTAQNQPEPDRRRGGGGQGAKTEKGKSIINQLYRPVATIGDGGTADAMIDEAINGPRPDGKQHYKKSKRPRCRNQEGAEERIGKR